MMAIIIDNDLIIIESADITVQSTATGFAKANVMNHTNLKRRWRMDSLGKSNINPVMYFNLSAQTNLYSLTYDSTNDVLIAGTYPDGQLWKSSDAGETWTLKKDLSNETPAQTYVYSLTYDSTNDVLIAGTVPDAQIWKSSDAGETWTLKKDIKDEQSLDSIVLNDVNFDKVIIRGHNSSLGVDWTTASYNSGTITINKDTQVNRYSIYIPLTNFKYGYIAIIVPTTASVVGIYFNKWEIGRIGLLHTATEFSKTMSRNYKRGAERAFSELNLKSGHDERLIKGPIRWIGTLDFQARTTAEEADLTTLNNMDIGDTLIFYENNGDTSKVYFCLRDDDYFGTYISSETIIGCSIRLKERI